MTLIVDSTLAPWIIVLVSMVMTAVLCGLIAVLIIVASNSKRLVTIQHH